MTLTELLPSLGCSVSAQADPRLWPGVSDRRLGWIAATFGTPTYVLDENVVREQCRRFRDALPGARVAFASKALSCKAVVRWVLEEGLSLDVCSAGELAVARAVGFPAERVLLHGNAKTPEDLKAAQAYGVGRIVVDSLHEIDLLTDQRVLLRVMPGIAADTHPSLATGVDGQKFGLSASEVEEAVRRIDARPDLTLEGLHCHVGSQIRHVATFEQAARRMVALIARLGRSIRELDLGGGFAVPYTSAEPDFDLTGYADRVTRAIRYECARHRVPVPELIIEPGRAIVARAGVTLYRVTSVKHPFVAVDGGMSDNARPALYQARYQPRLLRIGPTAPMTLVGRHCEAGDVLAADVPLPRDVHPGDVVAVPVTGAYHHSLASNYNQVGRPALVGVRDGLTRVLVRAETEEDLLRRDVG
ncbi:diaminopimelate decarboxylase [Actinosynnema sp. NPDC047251]|uniref:Diaminopimelate decarboxylase n=1 Tax=Saccharothrix espanaensis (strain ATCC 51144 / DSM 44229 / JCM 9112 / NBRC 15066 / NRRL 15764) TaxID=1179773 RepID=K0K541_SACES|nr:diaminopimelate decarboxylase [Saccharothrix espanaensis]CCH35395.1 Diaminopimelate decarboxylase [Saccharothrix espanaensis DSM 44229]